ncbi:MAG TPA: hypothetical protein VFR17_00015 [Mycobacterium sp.]|nr:hypothetical protein [Mycobacterium sp.]
MIETGGKDISIHARRNGFTIRQGPGFVMVTRGEAIELARALADLCDPGFRAPDVRVYGGSNV